MYARVCAILYFVTIGKTNHPMTNLYVLLLLIQFQDISNTLNIQFV